MPRTARRPAVSDPAAIRARLRELVAADGRTQAEIGEAAGMAQAQVWAIISGRKADPSARSVGRLLAALGAPWGSLDG